MELMINGQLRSIPEARYLSDVVDFFKLDQKLIVIEHNYNIITKEQYSQTPINERDRIEIVHFVGGG